MAGEKRKCDFFFSRVVIKGRMQEQGYILVYLL